MLFRSAEKFADLLIRQKLGILALPYDGNPNRSADLAVLAGRFQNAVGGEVLRDLKS